MTPPITRRRRADAHPGLLLGALACLSSASTSALRAQIASGTGPAPFVVTDSSVRQGPYEAVAISRDTILSSYPRAAAEVHYKFSINSQENEFPPGTEHTLFLRPRGGRLDAPVQTFGVVQPMHLPTPEESASSEEGVAQVTFHVDMRPVLRSFRDSGFYDPPNGPRIAADSFHGVYVIGTPEPLTWDFRSLRPGSRLQMTDPDGDSIYTVTVPIAAAYTRPLAPDGRAIWARTLDLSAYPQLTSAQRLPDALYRMSLEELRQLVREDGAFSAGARWPGVWTRDISLSGVLSLALIAPDATRRSLLAKVDSSGRIIQDTGTGGSWPISTDRMVWSLAAWELYESTGDRAWLRQAFAIVQRSARADLHAALDRSTGLLHGESSFLDWREQSYPRWMQPADIYQSQALGTNAEQYATYRILAQMARALGQPAAHWDAVADTVRHGMSRYLWQSERGWYGQYRYGRNFLSLSPRAEGLGEALSVIYGVAGPGERERLMRRVPVTAFGEPSFWPYTPGLPLYHNAAIWPFVTAYWTWAGADAGNTAAVELGLAAMERAAALFLTNKENMVAATGHFEGTVLNSDRQLWSVAGNLAMTYRLLLGMRLHPDRLGFRPMVPPAYAGERTLRNLRYRDAVLTVSVRGFGNAVASASLDGRAVPRAEIAAGLTGAHTLEIAMNGRWPSDGVHLVENRDAPDTPHATLRGDTLVWNAIPGAAHYTLLRDGSAVMSMSDTHTVVRVEPVLTEYQVLAVDSAGLESFLSEPVRVANDAAVVTAQAPDAMEHEHAGFSGSGYLTLSRDRNTRIAIPVNVPRGGVYAIDARYANGSGPVNSSDQGAVRTLLVDGSPAGVLVLPQRGTDLWTDWGYSNAVHVRLAAGRHVVTIAYDALDRNMNGVVNTALLDHIRLSFLGGVPAPAVLR